jgi:hypothetical protein
MWLYPRDYEGAARYQIMALAHFPHRTKDQRRCIHLPVALETPGGQLLAGLVSGLYALLVAHAGELTKYRPRGHSGLRA